MVQSKDVEKKTQAFGKEIICHATKKLQRLTNDNVTAPELNLLMSLQIYSKLILMPFNWLYVFGLVWLVRIGGNTLFR